MTITEMRLDMVMEVVVLRGVFFVGFPPRMDLKLALVSAQLLGHGFHGIQNA